nr:MAG TPA: hypothetical protein [Caudoviricetes sp.]
MGTLTAFLPPILWRHPARRAIRDYMVCKVWRTARRFDSATHHTAVTILLLHNPRRIASCSTGTPTVNYGTGICESVLQINKVAQVPRGVRRFPRQH